MPQSAKDRLIEFYRQYDPSQLPRVNDIYNSNLSSLKSFFSSLENDFKCPRYFELAEYDFYSKEFSPLLALYDDNVVPPNPMARPFDNLHKAQILLGPDVGAFELVRVGSNNLKDIIQ